MPDDHGATVSDALGQIRHDAVLAFANAFVVAALNRQVHERDSRWVEDSLADVVSSRAEVVAAVRGAGYRYVTLDLEGFRSGNLNAALP